MSTVRERVFAVLTSRFGVSENELSPTATFADLDLDSVALVEFALVVEQDFGVAMAEDEVTPDATIADAVELIAAKGVALDAER